MACKGILLVYNMTEAAMQVKLQFIDSQNNDNAKKTSQSI